MKKFSLLSLFTLLLVVSCGGPAPIEITSLDTYADNAIKFSVQYPSNWIKTKTTGERFTVYSSNDAKARFLSYATEGFPGALIDVYATKVNEAKTLDTLLHKAKIFDASIYKQSKCKVDGVEGIRLDYTFPLSDGDFKGVFIIASKDNVTYTSIKLETFGDAWDTYQENFDKIIASLKLAETQKRTQDTLNITEELPFPSEKLVVKEGNGFTISIPDNFYAGKANSQGSIAAYNYIGDRRGDCNIMINVIDGSKTKDLSKAANAMAGAFPGMTGFKAAKLGGVDGFTWDYKSSKDVKGRVYFVKHNNNIYRVITNWYVPEEANYLPVFTKCLNTFKAK